MLPAITANLPVYQAPPRAAEADAPSGRTGFGPDVVVDLELVRRTGARNSDRSGVYGPDGQFVESGSRRELRERPRSSNQGRPESEIAEDLTPASRETESRAAKIEVASKEAASERDLTLEEVDAAVPPAAREELRALADRVNRRSQSKELPADEYKKIADLMERIGRHEDAQVARKRAEDLSDALSAASTGDDRSPQPDPSQA